MELVGILRAGDRWTRSPGEDQTLDVTELLELRRQSSTAAEPRAPLAIGRFRTY
jgi:hypothetical protein